MEPTDSELWETRLSCLKQENLWLLDIVLLALQHLCDVKPSSIQICVALFLLNKERKLTVERHQVNKEAGPTRVFPASWH